MKTPLPKYGTYNLSYTGIVDPPRVFSSFRYPWIPNFFAADSKGSQSFSTIPQRETQPTTEGYPKSTHVLLWSAKEPRPIPNDTTMECEATHRRCVYRSKVFVFFPIRSVDSTVLKGYYKNYRDLQSTSVYSLRYLRGSLRATEYRRAL